MIEATVDELRNFISKEYYGSDERAYLLAVDIKSEYRVVKRSSIQTVQETMTLRDYFAGQAIIGVCVNTKDVAELDNLTTSECIAKLSYRIADAMLREREK